MGGGGVDVTDELTVNRSRNLSRNLSRAVTVVGVGAGAETRVEESPGEAFYRATVLEILKEEWQGAGGNNGPKPTLHTQD